MAREKSMSVLVCDLMAQAVELRLAWSAAMKALVVAEASEAHPETIARLQKNASKAAEAVNAKLKAASSVFESIV